MSTSAVACTVPSDARNDRSVAIKASRVAGTRERSSREMTPKSISIVWSRSSIEANGVGQQRRQRAPIGLLDHRTTRDGLADARRASDQDEPVATAYGGEQPLRDTLVRRARVQELRIRRQVERRFRQTVERFVGRAHSEPDPARTARRVTARRKSRPDGGTGNRSRRASLEQGRWKQIEQRVVERPGHRAAPDS